MEKLFEASVKIDNKDYYFQISPSSVNNDNRYGADFPKIEKEIKDFFYQGYEDNQKGKSRMTIFPVRFKTDGGPFITHLKSVFKQAYNYGYKKYDEDQRKKNYIDDLDITDPLLESKIKLLIDKTYSQGFFDGKRGNQKKNKIEIEEEFFFINDINILLLKVYNDGYDKGKELFDLKYQFQIPKITDEKLESRIKKEITSAYYSGVEDFDSRKKVDTYTTNLDFIKDDLLKKQISYLVNIAYQDGYSFNERQNLVALDKKRKKELKNKEEQKKIYSLIKKHGEPVQQKFMSFLYKYVTKSYELKIKEDYDFIIKGINDKNLLNQVTKIINSSYYKGQEDAINGSKKEFFIFSVPYGIKDQLIKNEFINLVNKAYSDGYQKIMKEISSNMSSNLNKDSEKSELENLLGNSNFKSIKMIKNLPDHYINQKVYSVEVPNEY
jgi:hypothetical protein